MSWHVYYSQIGLPITIHDTRHEALVAAFSWVASKVPDAPVFSVTAGDDAKWDSNRTYVVPDLSDAAEEFEFYAWFMEVDA